MSEILNLCPNLRTLEITDMGLNDNKSITLNKHEIQNYTTTLNDQFSPTALTNLHAKELTNSIMHT